MKVMTLACLAALAAIASSTINTKAHAQAANILQATFAEPNQKTQQVSTEQVRRILTDASAIIIDTRPRVQFEAGHIPGAHHLDGLPADKVAAVERLVNGNKNAALVLYCNGPFCQTSRRFADQLVAAHFGNVRRYQVGIPIWRALGGPTEIELPGITRIFGVDRTAVFIDARPAEEFAKGTIPGARNLTSDTLDATQKKMMSGQLKDAPLPLDDFNRRIVLVGHDGAQARELADAMSRRPWHNVAYFPGTFAALAAALGGK
jgi:rhodanese-related sulfurtransferase